MIKCDDSLNFITKYLKTKVINFEILDKILNINNILFWLYLVFSVLIRLIVLIIFNLDVFYFNKISYFMQ